MVLVGLVLLAGACSDGSGTEADDGEPQIVLTVYMADEVVAEWTLDALQAEVEFVTLVIDGDEQSGPRVLDVLTASGITDWETAEVLGKGEGRSFDIGIEINADEVDEEWLFDVTNRGTLKLAAADLPREQWVRDAGEIRIP
jgi:hypothetical protein